MHKLIFIFLTLTSCYCYCSIIINDSNMLLITEKLVNDELEEIYENEIFKNDTTVGRTFGGLRRLKIAIPAIMYKLGVVTTMLGVLTFLAIKGVLIGLIILIIQLSAGLSKLHGSKKEHGWEAEPSWGPWQNKVPQNVHVHVHGTGHHPSGHYSYSPHSGHYSSNIWDKDRTDSNSNLNLYASLTPYSAYNNYYKNTHNLINSRIDDDLLIKLREYKELKELRELRDSLYQQVV